LLRPVAIKVLNPGTGDEHELLERLKAEARLLARLNHPNIVAVYDVGDGPRTIVNPTIKESRGEWVYDEGCLSIPHLYVEMVRPKEVLMAGWDLDGNEVEVEADELTARLFQHELDHLQGILMFDRMSPEQRREAMREYRRLQEDPPAAPAPKRRLRLS
jgi:peptide deformylase